MNVNLVGAPTFALPQIVQHKAAEPAAPATASDLVSLSAQPSEAPKNAVTVPRAVFTATCGAVGAYAGMTFLGPIGGALGVYFGARHGWSNGAAISTKSALIMAGAVAGGAALGAFIGGSTTAQACGAIGGYVVAETMLSHH